MFSIFGGGGSRRFSASDFQACMRIHQLAKSKTDPHGKPLWDVVVKIASIGMPPEYEFRAKMYAAFVEQWSGGSSGHILEELLAFEKQLRVKRSISAVDMKAISKLPLSFAPRYVAGMVKACPAW